MSKLREILNQEDTVLFIGSGVSRWSGLPTWSELIELLAQTVEDDGRDASLIRAEASAGDLIQAASYGFDKLSKAQIGKFIRSACKYGIADPHEIHRKIVTLGPRCYITTNYDDLLERSLRKWQHDIFYRPPVTNRHLTETADIVHARAIDYIFKPHGDAGDVESVVLTREQYRELLPQGGKYSALETLKMIMTTRPVVYIGFGLRDPDFLYLRDLLSNTFNGGVRDHYAIMADVTESESDYWRRNYGIHLINYSTTLNKNGKDHSQLLTLLDDLIKEKGSSSSLGFDPNSPKVMLALARYASSLVQTELPDSNFEIRVHADRRKSNKRFYEKDAFDDLPVDQLLVDGPQRALIVGLPGAGKSFAFRKAASRLADRLNKVILSDEQSIRDVVIPILVDLKFYKGDITQLIDQNLPPDLPFGEILRHFDVKVYIDSFNEMPRTYWEAGSYERDIEKFLSQLEEKSVIVGSRTSDGLDKFNLQTYNLDSIAEKIVTEELGKNNILFEGRFSKDVYNLLQRPFFFQYILNKKVILPRDAHPKDFYQAFFHNVTELFNSSFGVHFNIEKCLSITAYNVLNRGDEAFPLIELTNILKTQLLEHRINSVDIASIANWLVSTSVIIPYSMGRVAFVHQSVTEYLAARELVAYYTNNPFILREKLALTRWDQSLFLALSLLDEAYATKFLAEIIKGDFALALSAAKYLEFDKDEIIKQLLDEIPGYLEANNGSGETISWISVDSLPVSHCHVTALRKITKIGNWIGASAATKLIDVSQTDVTYELIDLMFDRKDDYVFCMMVGLALQPSASDLVIDYVINRLDTVETSSFDDNGSAIHNGIAHFLRETDLNVIRDKFIQKYEDKLNPNRAKTLYHILWQNNQKGIVELACDLLQMNGGKNVIAPLHYLLSHNEIDINVLGDIFTVSHVDTIISFLQSESSASGVLRKVCVVRPDLAEYVRKYSEGRSGVEAMVLMYSSDLLDDRFVFEVLENLIDTDPEKIKDLPFDMLSGIVKTWEGREELFLRLLNLREIKSLSFLLGGSIPISIQGITYLRIDNFSWWIEWISELMNGKGPWFGLQLGSLLGEFGGEELQSMLIQELNNPHSSCRSVLYKCVLPYVRDLSTDQFNEFAVSFMLADLLSERSKNSLVRLALADIATDTFVTERLLPLMDGACEPLLSNLKETLRRAGSRHGKRYLLG